MISVLCPTRNRPNNLHRFVGSLINTAEHPEAIELCFYIDKDDIVSVPTLRQISDEYSSVKKITLDIKFLYSERCFRTKMLNKLYEKAKHDIFFIVGDDMVMYSEDWDTKVINEFKQFEPDNIGILYADDKYAPTDFATHFFIHRNWGIIQGFLIPPYFCTDYGDTWINEIADTLHRKVKIDLNIEHMHYLAGKALFDNTYQQGVADKSIYRPDITFEEKKPERDKIAQDLIKFINSYK